MRRFGYSSGLLGGAQRMGAVRIYQRKIGNRVHNTLIAPLIQYVILWNRLAKIVLALH